MGVETLEAKNKPISEKDILISSFLFVTFAFCKAGAVIKGVPVTFSNVLCAAVVLCMLPELLRYARLHMKISIYYCLYVFFVLLNTVLHIGHLSLKGYLYALVVAASPLMYIVGLNIEYDKCMKILCISGIIVGLYSIAQWLFGLSYTTIPGVTLALGDAWVNKPIGYGFIAQHESTKMPSTTQNGNNVALLAILGIGVLLSWKPASKWRYAKWLSIGLFAVALYFSGSRSACYPYALLLPLGIYGCWKQYKDADKQSKGALVMVIVIAFLIILVLSWIPQLTPVRGFDDLHADIQIDSTQVESSRLMQSIGTMSGRTVLWKNMLDTLFGKYTIADNLRVFFIGAAGEDMAMGGEGFPLFVSQFGMISAMLFMGLFIPLLKLFPRYPIFIWSGLAFAGALMVDSSYNYPPILIWFFLLLGVMIAHDRRESETSHPIL